MFKKSLIAIASLLGLIAVGGAAKQFLNYKLNS